MCPGTLSGLARWRGAIDLKVVSLCPCHCDNSSTSVALTSPRAGRMVQMYPWMYCTLTTPRAAATDSESMKREKGGPLDHGS